MISFFKSLFFVMTVLSCLGMLFLLKRRQRLTFLFLLSFFVLGNLWRLFAYANSSRYYCFFIIICLYLTAYAIKCILSLANHCIIRKMCIFIIITIILLVHLLKLLGSFNNVYIIDLQRLTKMLSFHVPNSFICIYDKEFVRYSDGSEDYNKQLKIIPSSSDLMNYCVANNLFGRHSFYIVAEKNNATRNTLKERVANGFIQLRKTEHFLTSKNHNKAISVYSMPQFNPSPDIPTSCFSYNAFLKSYIPEFDTFIYHDPQENKLIWLIGSFIDRNTKILFQPHTDQKNLLPESRIQYGFDNRDFRSGDKYEKPQLSKYRIFEREIPLEYPITYIRCGFYTKEGIIIDRFFTLSER